MDQLNVETASKLFAIHPLLGYAASAIFLISAVATIVNTYRTKKNTAANEALAKLIEKAEERFNLSADNRLTELKHLVDDFRQSVDTAREHFAEESRQYKERMIKLRHEADDIKAGLSMIPRLQDRVDRVEKQAKNTEFATALNSEQVADIVKMAKDAKRRGGI